MNSNALVNAGGDYCTACGHPFIRNFVGFDTLPLVEFTPRGDMNPKKVMDLLKQDPPDENVMMGQAKAPQKRNKQ